MPNPGKIWYWMRELPLDENNRYAAEPYGVSPKFPGTSCADIKSKSPDDATTLGIYFIKDSSGSPIRRLCHMGVNPVLDLGGDGSSSANAAFSCRALYDWFKLDYPTLSGLYFLKPGWWHF